MLQLFWHCLDVEEEEKAKKFIIESFTELVNSLKTPLANVELEAKPLSSNLAEVVENIYKNWSGRDLPFCSFCKQAHLKLKELTSQSIPLLIYCGDNSELSEAAKKENTSAKWGLMNECYSVSTVYKPGNKYILWHEALHLFDVDDCHKGPLEPGPTCGHYGCLMQYIPTKDSVCSWPFLCKKNIEQLRNSSKKHKPNKTINVDNKKRRG